MSTPESKRIKLDPTGRPIPQGFDWTIDNGGGDFGDWRGLTIADLAGGGALAGPSSNITRTELDYPSAAVPVEAGACVNGFYLSNVGVAPFYYGATGVDADEGDVLDPGDRVWLPTTDSSNIRVMPSAAGCAYRGTRW